MVGAAVGLRLAIPVALGLIATKDEIDVITHASWIFTRGAAIDQHQPVGGQFDYVAIMADQDNRAGIGVERLHQCLARIDIEVVGRFVEDQQVRGIACDQRQCQARAFPAREFLHPRLRPRAGKAEAAQLRPHRAGGLPLHRAGHQIKRGVLPRQFLDLILGEISDLEFARRIHRAFRRGKLRGEQARQRGLAIAVSAQQCDTIIGFDPEIKPLEDRRCLAIADRRVLQRDHRRFHLGRIGKIEAEARVFDQRGNRLHLCEHLGARLRLFGGGGPRRVAGDVIL